MALGTEAANAAEFLINFLRLPGDFFLLSYNSCSGRWEIWQQDVFAAVATGETLPTLVESLSAHMRRKGQGDVVKKLNKLMKSTLDAPTSEDRFLSMLRQTIREELAANKAK